MMNNNELFAAFGRAMMEQLLNEKARDIEVPEKAEDPVSAPAPAPEPPAPNTGDNGELLSAIRELTQTMQAVNLSGAFKDTLPDEARGMMDRIGDILSGRVKE